MGNASMMKHWSSSEIPLRDRLGFWVDVVGGTFVRADFEPRRDQPLFGEVSFGNVGELSIGSVRSNMQAARRSPRHIADDPTDGFTINIHAGGEVCLQQDGRETELRGGDFALTESTRPFSFRFDGDLSCTALQIPRPLLARRIGTPEHFNAVRVDGATGLGAMVSSMLRELPARLPAIPAAAHERVADNIVDLVAAALLLSAGDGAPLSARLTLTRVKLWIETHLGEQLTGDDIARRCGLSVRHLNRLFAAEGSSLMHHVWERRLERCRRDLVDPALRHRSITDIAVAAGFHDLSHFSRAFRARFGVAPRAARALS